MPHATSASQAVEGYMEKTGPDVFENANRYRGPTSLLTYVAETALKQLVWSELPPDLAKLHREGLVYVHKLPYSLYIPYCCGHSLQRLLRKGLKTPTVVARPARHLDTYVDHVANYLMAMQHYFSGAQAVSAVELYAGPFIRRDGLSRDYRAVKQAVQRLVYNLNFPSRAGMQTPFTNFTVVLDAAGKKLARDEAIYAGEPDGVLGDYLEEARLFVKALYEIHAEGDALGRPFTFPIPTIMTTSKMLYEDPEVFEAVFTAAARKGAGYWLNTRIVDPDASFAMCCRINIDARELLNAMKSGGFRMRLALTELKRAREEYLRALEKQRHGGLWAMPDITGSKAVVTLNLPRLVMEAGRDDQKLEALLSDVLAVVRKGLLALAERYARMAKRHPDFYMMPLEYVPEVFQLTGTPYFLTVGVIGLPEAAALMEGDPHAWTEGSRSQWLRMAEWMRRLVERIVAETRRWSMETGVPFNVEEVPGESAAAKLASRDARTHPEVLDYLPDKEEPIYSTSVAPYYAPMQLWERVEVEERVQPVFTGGVMMHIFLGEEPDPEALAKLTRRLTENTSLVYWSYTPAVTVCPRCGWSGVGAHHECPRCGNTDLEIWSRIIGYYRPLKNWNPARRREFWHRHHYKALF